MSTERYSRDFSDDVRRKIKFFALLVIVCFLGLWLRVWYLQVLKGSDFMGLSENNRVRLVSLPSYRGEITDRNGVSLASIRPSFNLYITPEDVRDLGETLNTLKEKIDFDIQKVKEDIRQSQPFLDVLVKADIPREQVAFVEENNRLLGGIHLKVEPLRDYHYGELAAHTLGYLGEINRDKLMKGEAGYRMGDIVGKEGIEFLFEQEMQGKKGYKEVEVDVSGRELAVLRKSPPQSGNHLQLTLDLRIQQVVEQAMTGTEEEPINGSAVVLKVQTGEILAINTASRGSIPICFLQGFRSLNGASCFSILSTRCRTGRSTVNTRLGRSTKSSPLMRLWRSRRWIRRKRCSVPDIIGWAAECTGVGGGEDMGMSICMMPWSSPATFTFIRWVTSWESIPWVVTRKCWDGKSDSSQPDWRKTRFGAPLRIGS